MFKVHLIGIHKIFFKRPISKFDMGISCFRITFADVLQWKHVTINFRFFFSSREDSEVFV